MIFKRPLVNKILAGQKTQTRRPVKGGELRSRYRIGRRYAVQPGRGKRAIARIRITDVRREQLGDIDAKGAQLEGFKRRDQFMDYWLGLYGRVDEEQLVWVLTFELEDLAPRFLAPSSEAHDYTSDPSRAIDPLEVVPDGWGDPGREQAIRRHRDARADDARRWNALSVGARVREVALSAERAGLDITEELAGIARLTDKIERKRQVA